MEKTFKQRQDIRNRWQMRGILRQIQSLLPEGFHTTNTKPVKKKIGRVGSCGTSIHWTSWCKNGKDIYLALLDGNKVKLIAEKDIKAFYRVKSLS